MRRGLWKASGIAGLIFCIFGCPANCAARPQSSTFDSNGVKIAYAVRGMGKPVVLIHGFLSSGWINWDLPGTAGMLAKDYRVITLDMPAHGASDKPTKDEAYGPELVEDVVRLLDPLKRVRKDWPVIEIKDADHVSCILKPQFKEEIQKWLARQRQR